MLYNLYVNEDAECLGCDLVKEAILNNGDDFVLINISTASEEVRKYAREQRTLPVIRDENDNFINPSDIIAGRV